MLAKLLRWFGWGVLAVGLMGSLVTATQILDVSSQGRPIGSGLAFLWTLLSGSIWMGLSSLGLAALLEKR